MAYGHPPPLDGLIIVYSKSKSSVNAKSGQPEIMITRLELDGFKTFQDFKLELAPFQVIVGSNGAGKSNLVDALRLLSRLADADLRSAFQGLRGEAGELFTILPEGQPADRMRLAVEMLVERQVQDSWGAQADLKYTLDQVMEYLDSADVGEARAGFLEGNVP